MAGGIVMTGATAPWTRLLGNVGCGQRAGMPRETSYRERGLATATQKTRCGRHTWCRDGTGDDLPHG